MKKLRIKGGSRALAIVAHPDDETIWLGGTILSHPMVHWTVFCLTRRGDPDRCPKFLRVCERYGAEAIITGLDDTGRLTLRAGVAAVKRLLSLRLKRRRFDYLFTHGKNGEYGHPGHQAVHLAVVGWRPRQKLGLKHFLAFNYRPAPPGRRPSMLMAKDSDYYVKLSPALFREKKIIQSAMHGYPWNGIDNSLCAREEGFKSIIN